MADSDLTSRSHNLFRGQVNDKKNSKVFVQSKSQVRRKEFKYLHKSGRNWGISFRQISIRREQISTNSRIRRKSLKKILDGSSIGLFLDNWSV